VNDKRGRETPSIYSLTFIYIRVGIYTEIQ
jgi:hypothetical protein